MYSFVFFIFIDLSSFVIDSCMWHSINDPLSPRNDNPKTTEILANTYDRIETCVQTQLNSKQQVNFLSIHKKNDLHSLIKL